MDIIILTRGIFSRKKGRAPVNANIKTDLEIIARKQNYPNNLYCNLQLAYKFKTFNFGRPNLNFFIIRWVLRRLGYNKGLWVENLW